jgi:hypothetical protein
MNFEDAAVNEVSAAILSITGPYLDLSNPGKLMEQSRPLSEYCDLSDDRFPLAIVYIDGEACNQVANDRFEVSLNFDISLVFKFSPGESKKNSLERGKNCLKQIYKRIIDRQRSGEAKTMLYTYTGMEINGANYDNPDGSEKRDKTVCVAGRITFNQIEFNEEAYNG